MGKKIMIAIIIIIITLIPTSLPVNSTQLSNNLISEKNIYIYNNNEIEPLDQYKEIFTFIDAYVYGFNLKGIGPFYYIELWGVDCTIDIQGYRYPLFPIVDSHFVVSADHVIAPNFIGIYYPVTVDTYSVIGIALGNIEWD
ncbi:hypothetical protein AYK20_04515 [Thermoplasmatales archaeon SG8-52-1]|nr:MAG: hypothetical protein AYK20_04515 [Thermoplasmatales archaeon SG8-52-1]